MQLSFVRSLAYPANFIVWSLIDIVWAGVNLGFYHVLLLNIPQISGWSRTELLVPLGLFYLLNAFFWGAMYGNMQELPKDINKGTLDFYLIRPIDSQFLVSSRNFGFNLFPSLVIGIVLTWMGFKSNNLFNLVNVTLIGIFTITAIVISYSLWFMSVTVAMWFSRLQNIAEVFTMAIDAARFPTNIYPPILRFVFMTIFPLGLIIFLPSEVILRRTPTEYFIFPIVAAALFLALSHWFWNFALRHYSSASS